MALENDSASKTIGTVTKGNGSKHGLKRGSTPSRTTHMNKKTHARTTTTRAYNEDTGMQETTVESEPGSSGFSAPNIGGMLDATVLILGIALLVAHLFTSNQGKVLWNALMAINKQAPKANPIGDAANAIGSAVTNAGNAVSGVVNLPQTVVGGINAGIHDPSKIPNVPQPPVPPPGNIHSPY